MLSHINMCYMHIFENNIESDNIQPIAKVLLHLAIIEFFFFSGEVYYTSVLLGGGKIKLLFVITCGVYYLLQRDNFENVVNNTRKLFAIIFWVLICTYLFGHGSHGFQWADYAQFSIGIYLLCSSVDFDRFRNLLLKYLVWLSVISIIVQIGHDYLGIFPASTYIDARGEPRYLSLGLFTTEWGENRLASIFWEPGQYQIVIYYILVLFADEWSDISKIGSSIRKFGVLILAIVLTLSTTAYFILGFVMLAILVRSGSNYLKYVPIILVLGCTAMYFIYNSEAVQKKVEQQENENTQESSYTIRVADNIACLMVTMEDPLTGFGPGSDEMENRLFSEGSETSSNGWFYGSAQLGIPYILFLWICMWKNVRRINKQSNTFLLFMILFLSQANESVIYFPYIFMYVFQFAERKQLLEETNEDA